MRRLALFTAFLSCFLLVSARRARAQATHPIIEWGVQVPYVVVPPVKVSGKTVYGYGNDLLEWDETEKAIVRRVRMPARVVALASKDERTLLVTLQQQSSLAPQPRVDVPFVYDGARPGRGLWNLTFVTLMEARTFLGGRFDPAKMRGPNAELAIDAFVAWEKIDRTNPYAPALRGQLLARIGRNADAMKAFDAAADSKGAVWDDLLRVSSILEDEGAIAAASRAFDRRFEAMKADGIRAELLQSTLALYALSPPRAALAAAFAKKDAATIDRIEERYARLFPRARGGQRAFGALADWMHDNGRDDLAAVWRSRAAVTAGNVEDLMTETTRNVDQALPLIFGIAVIAPLVAFAIGARRSARRGDPNRIAVLDLVAAVLPLLLLVLVQAWAGTQMAALGRVAAAPNGLLTDAVAAPDVLPWIESRVQPTPERDALIAWVRAEQSAVRAGGRHEGAPPDDATMRRALAAGDWKAALSQATRTTGGEYDTQMFGFKHVVLLSALLFLLGWVVGGRWPRAAVATSRAIPGAPASLGLFGPVLGALFIASLASFAGVGRQLSLEQLATSNDAMYFGLESLTPQRTEVPKIPAWAWAALVTSVLVHAAGVQIDRVRDRKTA